MAGHDYQRLFLHSLILVSIVDTKAFLPTQGHLGWCVFRWWKWHLRVDSRISDSCRDAASVCFNQSR